MDGNFTDGSLQPGDQSSTPPIYVYTRLSIQLTLGEGFW